MFALLTETSGSFDLPVISVVRHLDRVSVMRTGQNVAVINLNAQERADLGWYEMVEESIDHSISIPGSSLDSISGIKVIRTYPGSSLKSDADLRSIMNMQIEGMFSGSAQGGFFFIPGNIPLSSDLQSQSFAAIIATALLDGESLPGNFKIRDMEGVLRSVNEAQFRAYRNQMAKHLVVARANANSHLEAIELLAGQAILDHDITSGWPVNPRS